MSADESRTGAGGSGGSGTGTGAGDNGAAGAGAGGSPATPLSKALEYARTTPGGASESTASSEEFTAATPHQKRVVAWSLVISTVAIVWIWAGAFKAMEQSLHRETRVDWQMPDRLLLKSGPPSFYFDRERNQLVVTGIVDKALKAELVGLADTTGSEGAAREEAARSYRQAVDTLAYKSIEPQRGLLVNLLILGGLSGLLGVQLRSLNNFVGVTCYKNTLDVIRWWPWYFIRPFSGIILGATVVVLIEAGLFKAGESTPSGTIWWVAVALLAGFGADEFTLKLRLLTQTLFGQASSKERTDEAAKLAAEAKAKAGKGPTT